MKIFLLIVFLIFVAGCSGGDESSDKGKFLAWCKNTGMSRSVCQCIFSEMMKEYTPEELMEEIKNAMKTGVLTERYMDAGMKAGMVCSR